MIGEIIIYIIGIISGFILCSIFTYIGIKNRDDEISLLDKKCKKYQEYIDDNLFYNEEFIKVKKNGEDNE